jgi:hypothetical protein
VTSPLSDDFFTYFLTLPFLTLVCAFFFCSTVDLIKTSFLFLPMVANSLAHPGDIYFSYKALHLFLYEGKEWRAKF